MADKTTRILEYVINGRDQSRAAFASVERSINRVTNFAKTAAGALGLYFGTREIKDFAKDIIGLASDAEETASKFNVVFGSAADNATERLDVFSRSAGRSRFELREMASDFQALLAPMGVATDRAADMSVQLTQLSTDLASFFNTSDQQATIAIRAGLVGESEPLRKYGVQLSAVRVQQEAFTAGIGEMGRDLTAAEKAQAAFNIILKDTALAQGDAIRTGDSFANQLKNIQGEWVDFKTELGEGFLPVATDFLTWINEASDDLGGLGNLIKLTGLEYKQMVLDVLDFLGNVTPQGKIQQLFGYDPIGEMTAANAIALVDLRAQIQQQLNQQDDVRRRVAGQTRGGGNPFQWQGPMLPPGGLDAFRAGNANEPIPVKVEGSISPLGASDNTGAVAGNFITGLAQATRSTADVQKKSLFAIEENKRINAEMRDILRSIRDGQGSGVQLVGGVFN